MPSFYLSTHQGHTGCTHTYMQVKTFHIKYINVIQNFNYFYLHICLCVYVNATGQILDIFTRSQADQAPIYPPLLRVLS